MVIVGTMALPQLPAYANAPTHAHSPQLTLVDRHGQQPPPPTAGQDLPYHVYLPTTVMSASPIALVTGSEVVSATTRSAGVYQLYLPTITTMPAAMATAVMTTEVLLEEEDLLIATEEEAEELSVDASAALITTVERRISQKNDDAEEASNGSVALLGGDLELVLDAENQTVGLRFTDIAIPRQAIITKAYLQFGADQTGSKTTSLQIQGHASDNAPALTTVTYNISNRVRTTPAVTWTPVPWSTVGEAGVNQQTPELKSIVQTIVNRAGWASGNAMAFIITGTGRRTAYAYDSQPTRAPLLHIEYRLRSTSVNQPPLANAGADQTIKLPATASLSGSATDDGRPSNTLTYRWRKGAGPGGVTFGTPTAASTTARFSVPGIYLLRLTVSDGALSNTDEVEITVNSRATVCVAPAFPGAEGFGAMARGGRGGRVIAVTTLADSGAGSLRAALTATGPRIVVFRTGGTIELQSDIRITEPYLTIAGQTAPGDGITIKGNNLNTNLLRVATHDVVIRYLRLRPGASGETLGIGLGTNDTHKVILDHLSVSWAVNENITTWYDTHDITIQWSMITEGLHNSVHSEGPHSKGLLLGSEGSYNFSIHHNLFAHNDERNPRMRAAGMADFTNNVIYNYGDSAGWISNDYGAMTVNFVGNYFKAGPNSDLARYELEMDQIGSNALGVFVSDNLGPHRLNGSQPQADMVEPAARQFLTGQAYPTAFVTKSSATTAYNQVLADAGSTLPKRDVVDQRIVQEVTAGSGQIIDDPAQVGGWPQMTSGTPPTDTDQDGMPDSWEQQYGFQPGVAGEGAADPDNDGYTNLEEYLNNTSPQNATVGPLHICS